ncbi:LysR family transcriptional regulator [Agrobacterium radiobacter]|jgi:DNA-binding transcriptional LysR family regulator|uniref:LysR family transcriptional regulator n=1 Tax=Agrobacterium radiobacter TaxID=362 RepID=UPI000A780C4A|nr:MULTISPECIES: LysR family transcriptional regulator [Agrobacterium tumefaciens complex]MBB4409329.1 DNA-binding transcriptional LysR family regulator [Agrobacterium radiobacter]MBB4454162.1 DNA-binding transcriptional LysR family regulator [Agrobacterium radiobacter]MCP2137948.1 DNA-binding transcriptional LysR family regulator [Rhizobium sp. SLBN-94]
MHSMNNLRGVDLNLLVVLDALLSERHVSRAALRLNMSQPAVSHALARLRVLLEDPLFTRHSGGLSPTIRALELSQPVKEALAQIRAGLGPAGSIRREAGTFSGWQCRITAPASSCPN